MPTIPPEAIRRALKDRLLTCLPYFLLLGLYLSLRGYHSFDGDQAYRLPLLLHRQDPHLYADDPFVQALDAFNPHRGSLALLDAVSRPFGLSAGLFFVFVLTFFVTCSAVGRLARACWPDLGPSVGWVAVCLVLAAKAGNIGTNHLFEAMVLDRQVALALGWFAIAEAVARPTTGWWISSAVVSLATIVHPSVGLQLALVLGSSWLIWAVLGTASRVPIATAARGVASLAVAVLPGLSINLPQGSTLFGELPASLFWVLSIELQNPQHMLPHLWRWPQWLAWFSYLALAAIPIAQLSRIHASSDSGPEAARWRLSIVLAAILVGLGVAWYAIEMLHLVRVTIFQPFRMGTVARGLALILVTGRMVALWRSESVLGRTRAAVLAVGFLGDWLLVVAAPSELAAAGIELMRRSRWFAWIPRGAVPVAYSLMTARGLNFLAHHDTESGHIPLIVALALGLAAGIWGAKRHTQNAAALWLRLATPRAATAAVAVAWLLPLCALLAALVPPQHPAARLALVRGLVDRCRFYPMPLDDIERMALWCRENTPESARFIGPPGPKTFRLWSRRSLAFNRAGSPYHGAGLADWYARFADHVDFRGTPEQFVRAYLAHRHEFEARYDALTDSQRAALALRQNAGYVIAPAPRLTAGQEAGPLALLHVEGRYAVYRVSARALVHRHR